MNYCVNNKKATFEAKQNFFKQIVFEIISGSLFTNCYSQKTVISDFCVAKARSSIMYTHKPVLLVKN